MSTHTCCIWAYSQLSALHPVCYRSKSSYPTHVHGMIVKGVLQWPKSLFRNKCKIGWEKQLCRSFCSKMFRNVRKWAKCGFKRVFGSARKLFGFWFLPWQQLMMMRAEVVLAQKLLSVFRCFTNKMVLFGSLKAKQLILVSKIILTDPYVASRDLQGRRKPYKFGVQVVFATCRHSVQFKEIASCKHRWVRFVQCIVENKSCKL